jgi:hypothetical protein
MTEEENPPKNQERGFPSSLENAKSAFPTFPPLRLLLFVHEPGKAKAKSLAPRLRMSGRRWLDEGIKNKGIADLQRFD